MLKLFFTARQNFTSVKGSLNCMNYVCQNHLRKKLIVSAVLHRCLQTRTFFPTKSPRVSTKRTFFPAKSRHCSSGNDGGNLVVTEENSNSGSIEKYPLSVTAMVDKDYLTIEEVEEFLKEELCEDLCVIKVDPNKIKFHYVDFFVVVSGRSVRHLKSMAFGLCSQFKKKVREQRGKATALVEGEDCLDWMAVDIGNIVVHFMMPDARKKYELEKLWTLGPEFDDQYQAMMKSEEYEPVYQFKSKEIKPKINPNDS